MKQTGLWSRLNRRYRAALRERMGERGAAMMLAVLFVMVVLTTSALVMTTLLAQAIPYKNNKENSQANYAAESGLEVGLSYINETLAKLQGSTSLDDLQKVLPAVDADMNDSSKDGEFAKYDGASVLLNHVALNKTVKTSDTASYTPDGLSYRVRINFYDANPDDASAEMISSPSDLKNLQYAEVVATGFINRYKDGRTAGNTKSPQAMKRAVCRIEAKRTPPPRTIPAPWASVAAWAWVFMPRRPTTGSIRSSYGYPWIMMACPSDPIQPAKLNSPARWIPDTPIPASCPMALRR